MNGYIHEGCFNIANKSNESILTVVLIHYSFHSYRHYCQSYFELRENFVTFTPLRHFFKIFNQSDLFKWEKIITNSYLHDDISKYEVGSVIGKGAFGIVNQVKNKITLKLSAIKILPYVTTHRGILKNSLRELRLVQQLNHKNIVQFEDAYFIDDTLYLIFELCLKDLSSLLRFEYASITNKDILSFTKQLLSGLNYIHSKNVMHRDIKSSNLLITETRRLKICDFGMARTIHKSMNFLEHYQYHNLDDEEKDDYTTIDLNSNDPSNIFSDYVVTRWYRAPEVSWCVC